MALRPRNLPKIRHQLVKSLRYPTPDTALLADTEREALTTHLEGANLYWVAPPMAALAVHAGGKLEAARWANVNRPSPRGLIAFDGGVGAAPTPPIDPTVMSPEMRKISSRLTGVTTWADEMPVDALTWGGHQGACWVGMWIRRKRVQEALAAAGLPYDPDSMPPLTCLSSWPLPVTAEPVPFSELQPLYEAPIPEAVLRTLAAAWSLMSQPKLTDRSQLKADKPSTSTAARLGYTDPDITVVDLRRLYVPDTREETGAENGRRYRHRWTVDGHWRYYSDPRFSEERRAHPEWIADHIKGPEGAPMLRTERVNVWRR